MATIYDYVNSNAISVYWNEDTKDMPPFLGETLFPNDSKLGMRLDWIKGANNMTTAMRLSALDVKVEYIDREGFEEMSTKMPFFKEAMLIDEELRQKLLELQESNKKGIDVILRNIFNDEKRLLLNAGMVREVMRMQLLTTGQINIANNGQAYTYDFGVGADQKVTATKPWSDPTADVIGDITAWQDDRESKTGVRPTRAITSRKVMTYLRTNDAMKNAIYVFANGTVNITDNQIANFIKHQTAVTVVVNDKTWTDAKTKTSKKYVPEDLFILIPEGKLGNTWFGTTPEEADLMNSVTANVAITDTGVAITTTEETDPVSVRTKVSQMVLPSFEQADKIVIADVA